MISHPKVKYIFQFVRKHPRIIDFTFIASHHPNLLEQEMKAKAEEARANVIQAEAEVPKAMAEAFRSGNLGIMDYYRMKNIQADTSMRENIAKPETTFGNEPLSK